jgi:pimeloyl-ACP methyl ester carboxylesterase
MTRTPRRVAIAVVVLVGASLALALGKFWSGFDGARSHRHPAAAPGNTLAAAGVPAEQVLTVPTGGGTERVLYAAPTHAAATIVMLPGGSGEVGVTDDGKVRHDDDFVVRTRADWVDRGYAVLIPDAIDHADLRGERSTPAYAAVVDQLVELAQAKSAVPVFLMGTSQGSIAAMNGAAHSAPGAVAGVVLEESVSRLGHSGETVFSADPQDVRVPALVVANGADRCDVAPPQDASRIAGAMTRSSVQLATVSGGDDRSGEACGSLSPHGYYGIETTVFSVVDGWLRAHL